MSGRRVSNPQPPAWKAGALPIELLPLVDLTISLLSINSGGVRWIRTTEVERQQIYSLPHLATLVLPHSKSRRRESNPRPTDYKSVALPAELLRRFFWYIFTKNNTTPKNWECKCRNNNCVFQKKIRNNFQPATKGTPTEKIAAFQGSFEAVKWRLFYQYFLSLFAVFWCCRHLSWLVLPLRR